MDWWRAPTLILSIASVLVALTTILKFGKDFAEQIRSTCRTRLKADAQAL